MGEITGRKFFAIFASFFVVIIAVNAVLVVGAIKTFPGVEHRSPYVRNQTFDTDRAAQLALGWDVSARVKDDHLHLSIVDGSGAPVRVARVEGVFGRPTTTRDDQEPRFAFNGTEYIAEVVSGPGNWNLRLKAIAQNGTPFEQRIVLHVRP